MCVQDFLRNLNLLHICITLALWTKSSFSMEAVLLDTRTAISDLGWTMPAGSEWQEMTSSDPSGNQRRMLMACQIRNQHPNNWMRSQYIPVQGAQRVYVEMEFTIRSCEGIAEVATCKETFNLFYYETDRDEATTTFPPWNEEAYTKVDTIAADQRFEPGSKKTNFEIRDIGPIKKKGIYLALQDTGACVALMHVRVYYMYCSQQTTNLAVFARTRSGPEVTSLVEAKGTCVNSAIEETSSGARLHCNGKGVWKVPSGRCICRSGYTPNASRTSCMACGPGFYKPSASNQACMRCPDYSVSSGSGCSICGCMEGYYRSPLDDPELPCTKPPSEPLYLHAVLNESSMTLRWDPPLSTGGRSDLSYRVTCQSCDSDFNRCEICANQERFSANLYDVILRHVDVTQLSFHSYYKFKVCSVNGVTDEAGGSSASSCAETTFSTGHSDTSAITGLQASGISSHDFTLSWKEPQQLNGVLQDYQILIQHDPNLSSSSANLANQEWKSSNTRTMKITGLQASTLYLIKVRARTDAGTGPWSTPKQVTTSASAIVSPNDINSTPVSPHDDSKTHIILAVVGGVLLVLLCIFVVVFCRRKRRGEEKKKKYKSNINFDPTHCDSFHLRRNYDKNFKTYVDPKTYEDPNKAVLDFTREIDRTLVTMEEVIGQGESSEVYKGRYNQSDSPEKNVAIKTLKISHSSLQKVDFLTEASIMGQFDHPNVIRLEGVITKSHPVMIIMEYMENGALDSFLKKHDGEFPNKELVRMLRNVASGMKYLSDMGYVHRDLAARNILVNSEMICKVSDFGLSRELANEAEAIYTARGEKIPLRWTAPEAITFHKFTSASDVWSYGIVMWEVMSYGETPYWQMSNQTVMNAVESGNRLPAPLHCPQVLHHLMLDCWKKDRNQRPKFDSILSSLRDLLKEPWKIDPTNESLNHGREDLERQVFLPPNFSGELNRHLLRDSQGSSTPVHNTDSGINEDSDEESPMINGDCRSNARRSGVEVESHSLQRWLEELGLSQYHESFLRSGCTSIDQVVLLNTRDLTRIGIMVEEDQEKLMNNIQKLSPARCKYKDQINRLSNYGVPV